MAAEHLIGTHRYLIDDDLVHNMPDRGKPLDLVTMEAYTALLEPVFEKFGRVFLLVDGSSVLNIDAPARRHLAEWSRGPQILGTAIYGASLVTRTLITLSSAAMELYTRNRAKRLSHYTFFPSEAEARTWLIEQRRSYLNENPSAPR